MRRRIIGCFLIVVLLVLVAVFAAKYTEVLSVPAFQVRIVLSDAARKKIIETGEVIEGTVYFHGNGIRKRGEDTAPFRAVYLGSYHFKAAEDGLVFVQHASISKEAYERLSDHDFYYTVNVFSGRHVFKNNILNCSVPEEHVSVATKGPIEIRCDLIGD